MTTICTIIMVSSRRIFNSIPASVRHHCKRNTGKMTEIIAPTYMGAARTDINLTQLRLSFTRFRNLASGTDALH